MWEAVCDEDSASAAPSLLSGYKTRWVKTELRPKPILDSKPSHSFSLLVTPHTERNCSCNNINLVYQQKCPVFLFLSPYHQYFSFIVVLLSNENQLFSRMSNLPFTKRWVLSMKLLVQGNSHCKQALLRTHHSLTCRETFQQKTSFWKWGQTNSSIQTSWNTCNIYI